MKRLVLNIVLCSIASSSLLTAQQTSTDHVKAAPQSHQAKPETVLATFRVKPEQLAAFLAMMPEYWKALRELGLVDTEPHVLLQGEEDGKPIVVQVFTWKSEDTPDNAPPKIRQYWDRMNAMVETRNGKPGIEFPPMRLVEIEHQSQRSAGNN
jgi:hypothetical protein